MQDDIELVQAPALKKANPMFQDKVYLALLESCVIVDDFTQMSSLKQHNGQLYFLNALQSGSKRSLSDIVDARQDYFALRLALAEERVFSHSDKYVRAKLNSQSGDTYSNRGEPKGPRTVYNVNSILGSQVPKLVLGIIH
jgi:hypothetical protein